MKWWSFAGVSIPIWIILIFSVTSESLSVIKVSGKVEAGHYAYFRLEKPKDEVIDFLLKSRSGDADLYVSDKHAKPTFDFAQHNASSCSCGIDMVHISEEYSKTVFIGVYGHPRHEFSDFTLAMVSYNIGRYQPDYLDFDFDAENVDTFFITESMKRDDIITDDGSQSEEEYQTESTWNALNAFLQRFLLMLCRAILEIIL